MINQYVKYEDFVINRNQDNKRKSYYHSWPLWPYSDPRINRGHLLVMINQYVKYEDFVIKSNQDNEQKPFWHLRPLWTWPLSSWPKNQQGSSTSYDQSICEIWRQCDAVFKIISGNHADIKGPCDLDLWTNPKINRGHLLVKTNYSFQDNQWKPFGLPMNRSTLAKQ
jgi:hypothetical protein